MLEKEKNEGDSVCAICDDGGYVACCDGGCLRSFHLYDKNGINSMCRLKLGMIIEKVEKFICKNCKYKQHQCFVCGLLGSSDLSSQPEVFQCEQDDCGHFCHPKCVANLLYPDCELEAALFEGEVVAGQKFTCPMHECIKCRGAENKDDPKMKFAVCRRCPTVYHGDCLPSDILLNMDDNPNDVMPRAWDNVLPDRILIYCKKHEIVKKLGTPKRNHIIFPDAKKIRVPKMLGDPPIEQDKPEEGELPDQEPIEQDKLEEELLDQRPMAKPPQSKNQCSCSGHGDSFAPMALFMHPQPGSSCGWLDE